LVIPRSWGGRAPPGGGAKRGLGGGGPRETKRKHKKPWVFRATGM